MMIIVVVAVVVFPRSLRVYMMRSIHPMIVMLTVTMITRSDIICYYPNLCPEDAMMTSLTKCLQ